MYKDKIIALYPSLFYLFYVPLFLHFSPFIIAKMNDVNTFQILHRKHTLPFHLPHLIQRIHRGEHFLFVKYGDGEYECILKYDQESANVNVNTGNCDADVYFPELAKDLETSFYTLIDASGSMPGAHILIGKWHFPKEIEYLAKRYFAHCHGRPTTLIPFAPYHLVMNDAEALRKEEMRDFMRAIRDAEGLLKIVVSNEENQLLRSLFGASHYVVTPPRCLYLSLDRIMDEIYQIIDATSSETRVCLLTSCGLSAKVVIGRAFQKYGVRLSAVDIGSSFDLLCKKRVTRQYQLDYSYEAIRDYYQPFLNIE